MAPPNGSVRGYEVIDAAKAAVEKLCPGVVSCADIIVIATRVTVYLAKGRWYEVETGRKDGRISLPSEASKSIPSPTIPVGAAVTAFSKKGLSPQDFVVLLGGHTIGISYCENFQDHLYNFKDTKKPDPSMNSTLLIKLKNTCPLDGDGSNFMSLDQTLGSANIVDNGFYKSILKNNGILQIDQQIALDPLTKSNVIQLANSSDFNFKFGQALIRLGRVGVLTGNQEEIRKSCCAVNPKKFF